MNKKSKMGVKISEADIMELIRELHVYKIELEMQNEELERIKSETKLIAEKYNALYEFAPSGYFTLSEGGEIIDFNRGQRCSEKNIQI